MALSNMQKIDFLSATKIERDLILYELLDEIITDLNDLKEKTMAQFSDVQSLISAMNLKTNELAADVGDCAARVQAIQSTLASSPTSAQVSAAASDLQDIQNRLAAADTALKQIGADQQNPLP